MWITLKHVSTNSNFTCIKYTLVHIFHSNVPRSLTYSCTLVIETSNVCDCKEYINCQVTNVMGVNSLFLWPTLHFIIGSVPLHTTRTNRKFQQEVDVLQTVQRFLFKVMPKTKRLSKCYPSFSGKRGEKIHIYASRLKPSKVPKTLLIIKSAYITYISSSQPF